MVDYVYEKWTITLHGSTAFLFITHNQLFQQIIIKVISLIYCFSFKREFGLDSSLPQSMSELKGGEGSTEEYFHD